MAAVPAQEFVELLAVARGYQQSRALTVAAELGIADLLRDGPVPVDELAVATNTNAEALYRLLRRWHRSVCSTNSPIGASASPRWASTSDRITH